MEQEQNHQRGFGRHMTTGDWVRCSVWCVLILLFALWVGDFWPLIFLIFVIDLYWTKFIPWSWWKGLKNPLLRSVMSWVDAIVFAVVAVYFLQNFFFQNFQIPTTSLEKTMLAGDYLLVSKVEYGPRIPMTPLSLPFFQHTIAIGEHEFGKSYIEHPQVEYRRMAGLHRIERYDIVVFNYPSGDTVATKHQNDDYYRLRFHNGVARMHQDRETFGDIVYRPVDRRENYVKRLVGMPGDTLQIIDNRVYIDGSELEDPRYLQHMYFIHTNGTSIPERTWRNLGVYREDLSSVTHNASGVYDALGLTPDSVTGNYHPLYLAPLTNEMIEALRKLKNVAEIIPVPADFFGKDYVYPLSETNPWTRADYGPIWIPKAGQSIALTPDNVALYERCIRNYEGNTLEVTPEGGYLLNGTPADRYTFRMDYYWMMGDNRDNSADSRYWGFVPEDHIVGTPLFVWFSVDKETGKWRWDRIFKKVHGL
jgi:signal peptidase I